MYLFIKQKESNERVRMLLPLRIGTSPHADIIVNSRALLPQSYSVDAENDMLKIVALKDGSAVDPSEMLRFGLKIQGPFPGQPGNHMSFRQRFLELIVLERLWFAGMPERLQQLLGRRFNQTTRLSIWSTALTACLATLIWTFSHETKVRDLSSVSFSLQVGTIDKALYGASPMRTGYEAGVSFKLSGLKTGQKNQLRFDVGGLDEDKEIEILFNGKEIFESKADISCVDVFCSRSTTLPAVAEDNAHLVFRHNGAGTWLIKNILVQQIPLINPAERSLVTRWLEAAKRAWDDRSVSAENIVMASEQIKKAEELVDSRDGAEDLRTEIQVLKKEVTSSFKEIINDLTFKARRDLKLGDIEGARKSLAIMLRLYPDPAHKEHQRISKLIKETEAAR